MNIFSSIKHLLNGVDIDILLKKIDNLESNLRKVKGENAKKTSQITQLEQKTETLREDLVREQNKFSIIENKLKETVSQKVDLENNLKKVKNENTQRKRKITLLEQKIETLREDLVREQNKFSIIENELKESISQKVDLENNLNEVKGENAKKTSQITQLEQKTETLREDLVREQNKFSIIENDLNKVKDENAQLTKEKEKLETKIGLLNSDVSTFKQKIDELNDRIHELDTENSGLIDKLRSTEDALRVAKDEKDTAVNSNTNLLKERTEFQSQLSEKEDELQQLKTKISDDEQNWTNKIDALKLQLDEEKQNAQIATSRLDKYLLYEDAIEQLIEEEEKKKKLAGFTKELNEAIEHGREIQSLILHTELGETLNKLICEADLLRDRNFDDFENFQDLPTKIKESADSTFTEDKRLIAEEEKERAELQRAKDDLSAEIDNANEVKSELDAKGCDISHLTECIVKGQALLNSSTDKDAIRECITQIEDAILALEKETIDKDEESEPINYKSKRRILEVFDTQEGEYIDADEFFSRSEAELIRWRTIFERSITLNEKRFICPYCRQEVKISGRKFQKGQVSFFSHLKDSDYCEIKTTTGLTREQIEARKYGLIAESERHKRLKQCIYEALSNYQSAIKGVTDVAMEKRVQSPIPFMNWRRPDVMATYNGKKLVFELQLSTTFISVIVQREIFYRIHDYYVIWVFNFDDNKRYVDLNNLMCKDIYYSNKRNVFIFDEEAQEKSREEGELYLKCNWLDTSGAWHYPLPGGILVSLDMLTFDAEQSKPYYYDADTPYYDLHPEVKERLAKEEMSKREMLERLMSQGNNETDEKEHEKDQALKEMVEKDESAEVFSQGGKWGLRYNGIILVTPRFSSREVWDNELIKVGFNRHYGLYDKFGHELFECNYLKFHRLENGMIVAENTSGFFLAGFGRIYERRAGDKIALEELSPTLKAITHNRLNTSLLILNNYLIVRPNEKKGFSLCNLEGEAITEESYSEYMLNKAKNVVFLKSSDSGLWSMILPTTCVCEKNDISEIELYNKNTILFRNDTIEILDDNVQLIKTLPYSNIRILYSNKEGTLYIVSNKANKKGVVDNNFNNVLECEFDDVSLIKNLFKVRDGEHYGLYSLSGERLTNLSFSQISDLSWHGCPDGFIKVWENDLCGLLLQDGSVTLECIYEDIQPLDNLICVKKQGLWALLDDQATAISDFKYSNITDNSWKGCPYGYIKTEINDTAGLYSKDGQLLFECNYLSFELVEGLIIALNTQQKYGLYQSDGANILHEQYDNIKPLFQNEALIFKCFVDGEAFIYNHETGNIVEIGNFNDIQTFCQDVYRVQRGEKWGLYKIEKGLITGLLYSSIEDPEDDRAEATKQINGQTETGHIGLDGKEILSESYQLNDGYTSNQFFGLWDLRDGNGKQIVGHISRGCISDLIQGLYQIGDYGEHGVINRRGQILIKPEYSEITGREDSDFLIAEKNNGAKIFRLDGSQNGIPQFFRKQFSSAYLQDRNLALVSGHIVNLENFCRTEERYSDCKRLGNSNLITACVKNKEGVLNEELQMVIPFDYTRVELLNQNLIYACKTKVGYYNWETTQTYDLFDTSGRLILDSLTSIGEFNDGYASVEKFGQRMRINDEGVLTPNEIKEINEHLSARSFFGRWEIVDDANVVIQNLDQGILSVEIIESAIKIKKQNGYGILDSYGTVILTPTYTDITLWTIGLLKLKFEIYYGSSTYEIFSLADNKIISQKYSYIGDVQGDDAAAERDGRKGRLNLLAQEIPDCIEPLNEHLSKYKIFECWGVSDSEGSPILPTEFSQIEMLFDKYLVAISKSVQYGSSIETKGIYNLQGEILYSDLATIRQITNEYIEISSQKEGSALLDADLKVVIPFGENVSTFEPWSDRIFVAKVIRSNNYALYDINGHRITEAEFTQIDPIVDGRAKAIYKGNQGYLDSNGKPITEIVEHVSDTLSKHQSFGFWGIYNNDKCILPCEYDDILPVGAKYFAAVQHRVGYSDIKDINIIDTNGTRMIPETIRDFCQIYDKLFCITYEDGNAALLDSELNIIVPKTSKYCRFEAWGDSMIRATNRQESVVSIFNEVGSIVSPVGFSRIDDLKGGRAFTVFDGKRGFIDKDFNHLDELIGSIGEVKIYRKFGCYRITKAGEDILSNLRAVKLFCNNLISIKKEDDKFYSLYRLSDYSITETKFKKISKLESGRVVAVDCNDSKYYIDENGEKIIEYEKVIEISNGLRKIMMLGKWGIVDKNDNIIIPNIYDEIGSVYGKYICFKGTFYNLIGNTTDTIAVEGKYFRSNLATIIYKVGYRFVYVKKKSLQGGIAPKDIKLKIKYINKRNHRIYANVIVNNKAENGA